jgi:hypothetical protein
VVRQCCEFKTASKQSQKIPVSLVDQSAKQIVSDGGLSESVRPQGLPCHTVPSGRPAGRDRPRYLYIHPARVLGPLLRPHRPSLRTGAGFTCDCRRPWPEWSESVGGPGPGAGSHAAARPDQITKPQRTTDFITPPHNISTAL